MSEPKVCGICEKPGHTCDWHLRNFGPHVCAHAWCTNPWSYKGDSSEHHGDMTYVQPTTRPTCPSIGVGLVFNEAEQDAPWVGVHLDSGLDEKRGDVDEDTHLTLDEAIELRDLLDVAISHGLGVEQRKQPMTGGAR